MKIITPSDNIKLYPSDYGEDLYINDMPLHWITCYLAEHLKVSKDYAVSYIKSYYDIDLTNVIHETEYDWCIENDFDIYIEENPFTGEYEDKRDEFANSYRRYYLKFIDWRGWNSEKDGLTPMFHNEAVHHIHPLVYGGDNQLANLMHISNYHHDILHRNPYEAEEKYCHQALVYLWFLNCPIATEKNAHLSMHYDLSIFKNVKNPAAKHYYKYMIANEMERFYSQLS